MRDDPRDVELARAWLSRLRWAATGAGAAALAVAHWAVDFPMQLGPAVGVLLLLAASNLALRFARRRVELAAALVGDMVALTALLAFSGGVGNPFSVLYLVHVALAAVLLGPRWTWAFAGLSVVGFGLLFVVSDPHLVHRATGPVFTAHLWGMWLGIAIAATGLAFFVARLAAELQAREAELERVREGEARRARLVSLATLAAGAAHELGSPLATIAMITRDLEEDLGESEATAALTTETRAIRAQLDRCRAILATLAGQAGQPMGEATAVATLDRLWLAIGERVGGDVGRVRFDPPASRDPVRAPFHALADVLASLVRNGLLAGDGEVTVRAAPLGDRPGCRFEVADRGAGMPPEVRARAGEPFFTTRPTGSGMGLGLYLARTFAEGFGGDLHIDSAPGRGTTIVLELPELARD